MPQAQIDVGGDVSKIMVGSVALYVAPAGTSLPPMDGTYPIGTWPDGWVGVGYTDSGVELSYSPSIKEIKVDEETAPVLFVLDGEKAEISVTIAQATLDKLNTAISASIYASHAATMSKGKYTELKVGSGALTEVMIGFEGYAPPDDPTGDLLPAVAVGYRAMASGNVKLAFKRSDKQMFQTTFGLLADSTQPVGERLFKMIQIVAPHS